MNWTAGCILTLLLPITSNASLITNGDFEEPLANVNQGTWTGLPFVAGSNMGGWTVGGIGGVDLVRSFIPASGAQCVNLNGSDSGWIQQMLPQVVGGSTYLLRFALSSNPQGTETMETVKVSWGPAWNEIISYPRQSVPTWTYHSYEVVGTFAAPPILRFESLVRDFWGPMIDDVSLTLVPEPATIGVSLCILGLLAKPSNRRHR